MLRPFEEGRDEEAWLELANAYLARYYGPELEPLDEEDINWMKKCPWWENSRPLVAELGGEPVGTITPWVDRCYEPPRGYLWSFFVKPELEGSEVDRALLKEALSWLASEGAGSVRASARDNMKARIELLLSEGFRVVRSWSVMRLRPGELAKGLRPNEQVELRRAHPLSNEEDLRVLNALHNDAFSEDPDFRPETLEETRSWLEHEGYEDFVLLAFSSGRPVGFVVATVSKELESLSFKRGIIYEIGVSAPFRRRGIGTALMLAAIGWLASKGAEVIELSTDDDNPTGAPAFYARLGFKRAYRGLLFLKEL